MVINPQVAATVIMVMRIVHRPTVILKFHHIAAALVYYSISQLTNLVSKICRYGQVVDKAKAAVVFQAVTLHRLDIAVLIVNPSFVYKMELGNKTAV